MTDLDTSTFTLFANASNIPLNWLAITLTPIASTRNAVDSNMAMLRRTRCGLRGFFCFLFMFIQTPYNKVTIMGTAASRVSFHLKAELLGNP